MRTPVRSAVLLLMVLVACAVPCGLSAQPLPETVPLDAWGPAGTVAAIARQGDTLYVGGAFDYVGPGTGPLAVFATDSAEPRVIATGFDGRIERIVALPGGGWIAAGDIRDGASSSRDVVRLDAGGRIDPGFHVEVSGSVGALAVDGSRVFLGGSLYAINGIPRSGLAAVDAATGVLLPWNPVLEGTSGTLQVIDLRVHDGMVLAGGYFTTVNGAARSGFAAIDPATGATQPLTQTALATVESIAALGDSVYLIGRTSGFQRRGIGVSIATGQLLAWTLPSTFPDVARIVAAPARLYAASFNAVRALDPVTGAAVGPPLVDSATVDALAVEDGLLAVGVTRYSDGIVSEMLTFDAGTGSVRPWSLRLDARAESIGLAGGLVALAGGFRSAGGVVRRNLFALDVRTGRPTAFAPVVRGSVMALATVGDILVVGGDFLGIDGLDRRSLAAMTSAGTPLAWAPIAEGMVRTLAVSGNALVAGGFFTVVDGHSRPYLASVSLATGGVTAWLPVPNDETLGLAASGDTLYAVGAFEAMAAGPRGRGAAFSASRGTIADWDPRADSAIRGVAVAGSTVGVVGWFTSLGTAERRGIGFLDAGGVVLPLEVPYDTIQAQAIAGLGEHFFVGGRFMSGSLTRHLVAVSTARGAESWSPVFEDASSGADVSTLARYPDLLVAGGTFTRISGRRVLNLAVFGGGLAGAPISLRARVAGTVASLSWAPPAGVDSTAYVVEVGTAPGAANLGRFVVGTPSVSGALAPGIYYVRVRAVASGVEGQPSSEVVLTVPAAPVAPAAPVSLLGSFQAGRIRLAWTSSGGNAESFVIEAGLSPGQSNVVTFDTGVLDTAFSAPAPAGTYYVRIRARNAFGASAPSNEVQIVVP
jgi:hypothetical protein